MPWNDQNNSGGGGNGGPWGQPPRGGGPRGQQGPRRPGGGGGGQQPPDLEELIRQMQSGLGGMFGGGGRGGRSGRRGGRGAPIVLILAGILIAWTLWPGSVFYQVQPDEQGVVLRFGQYHRTELPGLRLKLPAPFETMQRPKVTRVNEETIGFALSSRGEASRDVPVESLMLTGDENIVDIDFSVFWVIGDAKDFLFNIRNPSGAVKAVAESAMREVVGSSELAQVIGEGRGLVEQSVQALLQTTLDEYGSGVLITQVQLRNASVPGRVIEAFNDVVRAGQDAEGTVNQAEEYRNNLVPRARGAAAQVVQAAEAYREAVVAEAGGEAERFNLIYAEYARAPEVTRRRMYLETMERVLNRSDKIIMDSEASQGVVPYLPLNELQGRASRSGGGDR